VLCTGTDDIAFVDEPSLEEDPLVDEPAVDAGPVHYEVMDRATQRGKPLLIDSRGYAYGIHRRYDDSVVWRCTKRSTAVNCRAVVRQQEPSSQQVHTSR